MKRSVVLMLMLLIIPLSLLAQSNFTSIEAGKPIKYPGLTLQVERVETTNLYDVAFYEMKLGQTNRVGKCAKADVEENGNGILTINFKDVTIEMKNLARETSTIKARVYSIRIDTRPRLFNAPQ